MPDLSNGPFLHWIPGADADGLITNLHPVHVLAVDIMRKLSQQNCAITQMLQ